MAVPEGERLRKLLALRGAQGGLSAADEKELKGLRRRLEMEVLENADVVCSTCVGAGDPRLANFRFQHVGGVPYRGGGGGAGKGAEERILARGRGVRWAVRDSAE